MIQKALQQCYGIVLKNLLNHWANKKKLLGEFLFPAFISGLYILMQSIFSNIIRPKVLQPLHLHNPQRAPQTITINDLPVSNQVTGDFILERTLKKVQTVPDDIRAGVTGAHA